MKRLLLTIFVTLIFCVNSYADVTTRPEITGVLTGDVVLDSVTVNNGTTASPALAFGDGDTGFYESIDDTINVTISGISRYQISGTGIRGTKGNAGALVDTNASSTVPTLLPNKADTNTGIGTSSADNLSLIAGGEETLRLGVDGSATLAVGAGTETAQLGGVIHVDTTQFSSPADTVENDAISYTLPANTLNTDGKIIRIKAWGQSAANTNLKTIRIRFDGTQLASQSVNISSQGWALEQQIVRVGASDQTTYGQAFRNAASGNAIIMDTTADETGAIIIKVTAQNTVASAGDIVVEGMIVEVLN